MEYEQALNLIKSYGKLARVLKTRKGQKPMKKTLFNLQLFADDAAATETGSDPENTTEQTTEQATEQKQNKAAELKYSDKDVDEILGRKFAEWAKKQQKQTTEAERLGKMTAEEKANERIKALEDKLAEAERKEARSAMTKEARAILQTANININDELLANLVSDDAESTQANVKSFISLFNAEVEKKVKEAYKGETPKKGGVASLTKEQILAVANRAERQRLINENMHLFK